MDDSSPFDLKTDVPYLDIVIPPSDAEKGAKDLLTLIRPTWEDKVIFEKGGIGFINVVLIASRAQSQEKIVIRVFTDKFDRLLDKQRERVVTLLLHELGISPRVICQFANGLCFEFCEGQQFHWKDFSELDDIRIAKSIVRELARYHCQKTRDLAINKYQVKPTNFIDNHIDNLLSMYPSEEQIQALEDKEVKELFKAAPSKATIAAEMEEMRNMVNEMKLPLLICHNDSNPSNIIYNRENDKCTIIDYDLTCFGFAEFDLAFVLKTIGLGFKPADDSSPRSQPEFWKEVLLEYLKTKSELDGEDEEEATSRLDDCYAKVKKMALFCSLVFVMYCTIGTIDGALFDKEDIPYGKPIDYLRIALIALLREYQTYYMKIKDEVVKPSPSET